MSKLIRFARPSPPSVDREGHATFPPFPVSGLPSRRGRRRFEITQTRPPPRRDRHVVLDVTESRNSPGNFTDIALEALVRHSAGQRRASSLTTHLDFRGAG